MNKDLLEIEEQLDEIIKGNQAELEGLKEQSTLALESKKELSQIALKEKENGNVEEYAKKLNEFRSADDISKYYLEKVEALENNSLIEEVEYEALKQDIMEIVADEEAKARKEAESLLDELKTLRDGLMESYQKANELLPVLQREVFKAPKFAYFTNGSGVKNKTIVPTDKVDIRKSIYGVLTKNIDDLERVIK